jgi:hypothetical protein
MQRVRSTKVTGKEKNAPCRKLWLSPWHSHFWHARRCSVAQDDSSVQPFSPDQLDNLLAPIALYPDPLLAQILPAATFPDQIDEAARLCRAGANPDDIDMQPWDVSVKAVAHYPTVLYMMADSLDWTTAVGQAYVNQNDDVMASMQRLRQEARNCREPGDYTAAGRGG